MKMSDRVKQKIASIDTQIETLIQQKTLLVSLFGEDYSAPRMTVKKLTPSVTGERGVKADVPLRKRPKKMAKKKAVKKVAKKKAAKPFPSYRDVLKILAKARNGFTAAEWKDAVYATDKYSITTPKLGNMITQLVKTRQIEKTRLVGQGKKLRYQYRVAKAA